MLADAPPREVKLNLTVAHRHKYSAQLAQGETQDIAGGFVASMLAPAACFDADDPAVRNQTQYIKQRFMSRSRV